MFFSVSACFAFGVWLLIGGSAALAYYRCFSWFWLAFFLLHTSFDIWLTMYLVVAVSCITGTAFWSVTRLLVQAAAAELRHLLYPPLENRFDDSALLILDKLKFALSILPFLFQEVVFSQML